MKFSINRILAITAISLASALVGAFLGANYAYDQIAASLPAMIEDAGCD